MSNLSSDAALAFFIGALVGVGAALLLETRDDETASAMLRQLRREGVPAHLASRHESRQLRNAIALAHRISMKD